MRTFFHLSLSMTFLPLPIQFFKGLQSFQVRVGDQNWASICIFSKANTFSVWKRKFILCLNSNYSQHLCWISFLNRESTLLQYLKRASSSNISKPCVSMQMAFHLWCRCGFPGCQTLFWHFKKREKEVFVITCQLAQFLKYGSSV